MLKLLFLSLGCFCGGLHADAQFDNKLKNYNVELADQTYSFKSHQVFSAQSRDLDYDLSKTQSEYCHFEATNGSTMLKIYRVSQDSKDIKNSSVTAIEIDVAHLSFDVNPLGFSEYYEHTLQKNTYVVRLYTMEVDGEPLEAFFAKTYGVPRNEVYSLYTSNTLPYEEDSITFESAESAEKFCQHLHNLLNP